MFEVYVAFTIVLCYMLGNQTLSQGYDPFCREANSKRILTLIYPQKASYTSDVNNPFGVLIHFRGKGN